MAIIGFGVKVGNRQFRPSVRFSVLYVLVGGCMVALGLWQLERANEKIVMQEAATAAARSTAVDITQIDTGSSSAQYARVSLRGRFDPGRQFLWDNRIAKGRAGFEVITPFQLHPGKQWVLVNRGWVPIGQSREDLPAIAFTTQDDMQFTGVFTQPSIGFSGGDAVNLSLSAWPRLLQHFDYEQVAVALGEPVLPGLVQVVRSAENGGLELFPDNWQPVASGPERHYGYAFQWFAMFVALTIIYFVLNSRKTVASQSS